MAHVVFGLVLVVNLVATSVIAANHLEPFADLATYYQEGQMLAQGRGFTQPIKLNVHSRFTEAPYPIADRLFFPIAVAAALSLFGDSLAVANVVAAASMALTAVPLYLLTRRLFDSRVALLATVLFALNPFYHIIGVQAWTDLTATLFYYWCLLAVASYFLAPSDGGALLSGVWLTLAVLTREESILLALPLVVVWWWRGRNVQHGVLFALAPLIGFGLRAVYLFQTFGNPLYAERPYFLLPRWALWYYLGTFTPQEYLDYVGGIGGALAIRVYNYTRFVENIFSDGMAYFTQVGLMPILTLIAVGAAYRFPQSRAQRSVGLLLSATVAIQLLLSLGYVGYAGNSTDVRHGQLIAPFLLMLAAAGLVWLWDRGGWRRGLATALSALYLLFAVSYLGAWGAALAQPVYNGPSVLTAVWARDHLPTDAVLMTRNAADTHYFSGRTVVVTPSGPFADMMAFARADHITHFIIGDVERSGAPNLLQGIKAYPQNFQTVYSTEGAQIVAVKSYDFPVGAALPNELYAGKTVGRPASLFNWSDLAPRGGLSIVPTLADAWRDINQHLFIAVVPIAPRSEAVNLRTGDTMLLERYVLANAIISRGDELQIALYWRALASTKASDTVFVHLLDGAGVLRAQVDAQPLAGTHPTNTWAPGESIEDHYQFTVPAELPSGLYQLEIGLYDSGTGERLPLIDANGQRLSEDRLLIQRIHVR